MVQRRRRC